MGKESRFSQDRTKQAAAAGVVFDSLGRQLQEGDAVIVSTRAPLIFRVMKIAPVFDPAAPAGTLQLQVLCMTTYTPKGGQSLLEVLRVGESVEMGPMPLKLIDAPPEETAPVLPAVDVEREGGQPVESGPRLVVDADGNQ